MYLLNKMNTKKEGQDVAHRNRVHKSACIREAGWEERVKDRLQSEGRRDNYFKQICCQRKGKNGFLKWHMKFKKRGFFKDKNCYYVLYAYGRHSIEFQVLVMQETENT